MSETNGSAQRAGELADEAAKEMRELRRELRKQADDARKEAAHQMHTAAENIRKELRKAKAEGEVRDGIDNLANGLEKAAHYLDKNSLDDMGKEVTRIVRKNPVRTAVVALIIGLLLGLMMRNND